MPTRIFTLAFVALLSLATSALAGLTIKKARYGNTSSYRDVQGVLEAYVRNGTLSFPVTARSMGGDPSRGQTDFLFVIYEVNGREFTDTIPQGQIFTFRGLPNVRPVRPPLSLPFLRPSSPLAVPLALVNRSGLNVSIYSVDRYGRWVWAANVIAGQTISISAQVGQDWVAADASGRELARSRIARSDNVMVVDAPGLRPGRVEYQTDGDEAWVRFENTSGRTLYLYNLDPLHRWNWMATLEPNGGYSASTRVGETWIATDTANRVVRQINAGPGQSRVRLN
jgi:hypothetical protein